MAAYSASGAARSSKMDSHVGSGFPQRCEDRRFVETARGRSDGRACDDAHHATRCAGQNDSAVDDPCSVSAGQREWLPLPGRLHQTVGPVTPTPVGNRICGSEQGSRKRIFWSKARPGSKAQANQPAPWHVKNHQSRVAVRHTQVHRVAGFFGERRECGLGGPTQTGERRMAAGHAKQAS